MEVAVDHFLRPCMATGASALATWPPQSFGVGLLAMAIMTLVNRHNRRSRHIGDGGANGGDGHGNAVLHAFFDGDNGGSPSSAGHSTESDLGNQLNSEAGSGCESTGSNLTTSYLSTLSTPVWFLYRVVVEALKFALLLAGYAVRVIHVNTYLLQYFSCQILYFFWLTLFVFPSPPVLIFPVGTHFACRGTFGYSGGCGVEADGHGVK